MKKAMKIINDYFFIALGSFILAFAITFFLTPCKISTGGVSGVGVVLYHVASIPLSVTTFVINMALFFFGYKTLPKGSVAKTVAGIIFLSVFLEVTAKMGSYTDDILISSVFGGVLVGLGVGLTVWKEASTGGSDFAALILHKIFPHISIATFILLIDTAIIVASGAVFDNYTIMFYSVISLYISSKVTYFILIGGDRAKSVYIISKEYDKIATEIMNDMKRGVTGIYSYGCFGREDTVMLMCIVRSKEVAKILEKVKMADSLAFTIISDVIEVRGEGFKEV